LENVRLSFPKIFKPERYKEGDAKYSATFLIDPQTPEGQKNIERVTQMIKVVCEEKWGRGKVPVIKEDHRCFDDGNLKKYDGYQDQMFLKSSDKIAPMLIDRDKSIIDETRAMRERKLYAGCYVNAVVSLWAYDTKTSEGYPAKGYNASLRVIQFRNHGEEFTAREAVEVDEWFNVVDEPLLDVGGDMLDEDDI
jgi:hypothetical protein